MPGQYSLNISQDLQAEALSGLLLQHVGEVKIQNQRFQAGKNEVQETCS